MTTDQLVLLTSTLPRTFGSLLKRGVRQSIRPGDDLSRLEALLRQEWERLSQAVINRLIESMSSRIRQVIELSGDVTKY